MPVEHQGWLLAYENPLAGRISKSYFAEIPKLPGVYFFLGEQDEILYVGKAKDLRSRLYSYRRAHPDSASRKTLRLIQLVRNIRWEICKSETAALLRENQLLRELCPPFNTLNTRPDLYYFIGLKYDSILKFVELQLTNNPHIEGSVLFGAYKGRGSVREGYGALLRLLWVCQSRQDRFSFPARLVRRAPPYQYRVHVPENWYGLLKRFLSGESSILLQEITSQLLENDHIPRFAYSVIQEDLQRVQEFFLYGPRRTRELKRFRPMGTVRRRIVRQDEIDDLIVLHRFPLEEGREK